MARLIPLYLRRWPRLTVHLTMRCLQVTYDVIGGKAIVLRKRKNFGSIVCVSSCRMNIRHDVKTEILLGFDLCFDGEHDLSSFIMTNGNM